MSDAPMGLVPVSDGAGGTRLEMRPLPPKPKGKKPRTAPDPIIANPDASAEQLAQIIECIERLEEEERGIRDDKSDKYAEAKAQGFDPKIIRTIIKIRRLNPSDRQESEALLETYMASLGLL